MRVFAGVAMAALLAACGASVTTEGSSTVTPPASAAPAFVLNSQGDLTFPRQFQADRVVEIQVSTASAMDGSVTSVRLESAYFEPMPATERGIRVTQGWPARLRAPLGDPVCPAGVGPVVAHVEVDSDGEVTSQVVTLPSEVLADINAAECAAKRVRDIAAPGFGPIESVGDGRLRTSVVLTRGSEGSTATLERIQGNIIFQITPDAGTVPADLVLHADQVAVPVTIIATRCDPHAFAEAKKPFVFPLWVTIDDGEPHYLEYVPDDSLRRELQNLFDECAPR